MVKPPILKPQSKVTKNYHTYLLSFLFSRFKDFYNLTKCGSIIFK